MRFDATRALIVYAGLVTLALLWLLLAPRTARFDTIDVQRVNLREGDGTLRLAIASRDRFPGLILHGREQPHGSRADSAGMIFYNDEGTENGGLIFGGLKRGGRVTNFGHLSFDQYDQDQVATLEQTEDGEQRRSGLTVADRPDGPLYTATVARVERLAPAARQAELARLRDAGTFGRKRAFFGKGEDRASLLDLRDGEGRTRLRLHVERDGTAGIEFLDAAGKVTRTLAGQ